MNQSQMDYIKESIKRDFDFQENPMPENWRSNAQNLWIYRQSLINKGTISERIYGKLMAKQDKFVQYAKKKTDDYDVKIDGIKKEVKEVTVGDCIDEYVCRLNQIRLHQNWKDLVVVLIFSNKEEIYEISKEELIQFCETPNTKILWIGGKRENIGIEDVPAYQVAIPLNFIRENFSKIF